MKAILQNLAMRSVDGVIAVIPQRVPTEAALRNCKIVSHRGEHDNRSVMENTLQAFDNASAAGVRGLECDIRWTHDQVPVICHDETLERVFGLSLRIAELPFQALRERVPQIPTLQEVVQRYGGENHLMLELKSFDPAQLPAQRATLAQILSPLRPGRDFHMLALDPNLFTLVPDLASHHLLPVAQFNVGALSKVSVQQGYAGLAGHYLLLTSAVRRRHQRAGQWVGTGFPRSRNALLREVNRGVEWVFSNDAVRLQRELNELLGRAVSIRGPMQ